MIVSRCRRSSQSATSAERQGSAGRVGSSTKPTAPVFRPSRRTSSLDREVSRICRFVGVAREVDLEPGADRDRDSLPDVQGQAAA
jgi:hypothetical protein